MNTNHGKVKDYLKHLYNNEESLPKRLMIKDIHTYFEKLSYDLSMIADLTEGIDECYKELSISSFLRDQIR